MGEFFVLQPILNKNLSQILKIRFHLPGIHLGRRLVKLAKNGFDEFGRAVLEG
jgi:hypothetical protein